jgi:farnesyl-diphosphate farnesyltransferase
MTRRYGARQRAALSRCIEVMCEGMPRFQRSASPDGLADLAEMREYCDVVAGVVGETLTELFCAYEPEIARHHDLMLSLGVSFGRGLQMTNILKDFWEDHDRGVCWLPRNAFARHGVRLGQITRERLPECFCDVYGELIAVAHGHLCDAREYTLLIPPRETGIRGFCTIALALALSTLQCINARRDFTSGSQVKVSRQVVANAVIATKRFASDDADLRGWLAGLARGLPAPAPAEEPARRPAEPVLGAAPRDAERAEAVGV